MIKSINLGCITLNLVLICILISRSGTREPPWKDADDKIVIGFLFKRIKRRGRHYTNQWWMEDGR